MLRSVGDPVLRLPPQTDCLTASDCTELLSPPAFYSSLCPVIQFLSPPTWCWVKRMGAQVLGSPLCELCFSFRRDQFHVVQSGFELTETHRFPQVLVLKVCATTAWPVVA